MKGDNKMLDELFSCIINGYCYLNQINSWWDLTEAKRLKFFKEYIEPYFILKDAAVFYTDYVL